MSGPWWQFLATLPCFPTRPCLLLPSPSLSVLLSPPLVFSCLLGSQAACALGPEDKIDALVAFMAKKVGSMESVSSMSTAQCITTPLGKLAASPPAGQ